jgi:hypothetical protein
MVSRPTWVAFPDERHDTCETPHADGLTRKAELVIPSDAA